MLRFVLTTWTADARWRAGLWICLGLTSVVVFPSFALALAALNAGVLVAHLALQFTTLWVGRREQRAPAATNEATPFVSIHLPICSEPPEVVQSTLDALARLRYPAFEVLVYDNNTRDEALWKPVAAHCRRLGSRFSFFHVDRLPGAKAGALNRCLAHTDSRAELVAVLDADYRPESDWLHNAVGALGRHAFVQFPQAYRNTRGREGLEGDYAHYFQSFMRFAEHLRAPLLTGTLCVIRRRALERVGGWSGSTITEDAELGVRLVGAGLSGRYVHRVGGRGLMPTALPALHGQRRRWVHGNAQTLLQLRPDALWRLGWRRALAVLAQLTAWFNFLLVPALTLLATGLLPNVGPRGQAALTIAGLCVWIYLLPSCWARWACTPAPIARNPGAGWSSGWKRVRAHLALAWVGAVAWIEPIIGVPLHFRITDKSGATGCSRRLDVLRIITLSFAGLTLVHLARGQVFGALGAAGITACLASSCSLERALRSPFPLDEARRHDPTSLQHHDSNV